MKINQKFWLSLFIFGLVGQIAWVIENMYLNVFIYKIFHASAMDISIMVGASALVATLTTWIMGAISDYYGKRKHFICVGYILWGISILGFRFLSSHFFLQQASLAISLVIIVDCLMTFFGSTSNDAAFNAWLTDKGDASNRGRIEGYNAIFPILAMILVFGSFMGLNLDDITSWQLIFSVIGIFVLIIGFFGFWTIEEEPQKNQTSLKEILFHSFKKEVIDQHKMLYATLLAFMIFNISIQVFMPYLLVYFEVGLGIENYALIFAPATIIAAIITTQLSKIYDLQGIKLSSQISVSILLIGYLFMILFTNIYLVFIGTLLIMIGYMTTLSVFGAEVRNRIPEKKAGQFQGIRMISQVLIPGIAGPMIGSMLLQNAKQILNIDGTTSFIPNRNIFIGAFVVGIGLCWILRKIYQMMRDSHNDLISEVAQDYLDSNKDPWQQHPTPQMKRESIMMLNGKWKLEDEEIIVPFPPQSFLSGYKGKIKDEMTYVKTFEIPTHFTKEKVLLHFQAVDQVCDVFVNDEFMIHHEGGYLPFHCDITKVLQKENTIVVKVKDTLSIEYPYGKQSKNRGGMWYTPISGIWQSVWLENVCENYIENIKITSDLHGVKIELQGNIDSFKVRVKIKEGRMQVFKFQGKSGYMKINHPILWTCENPYLYPMIIETCEDKIESYFALREIKIKRINGIHRVCLNNQPIFMHGLLDQGYYSDGIYIPANEKGYEQDILHLKELGFNLLRKHIKVEPEIFYYYCDLHGMLVMQDFVNNGKYHFIFDTVIPTYLSKKRKDTHTKWNTSVHDTFIQHSQEIVSHLYNHPCIIAYTIFNEGWGQFYSDHVYELAKKWDPTRLYDSTSGWFKQHLSDFDSEHVYMKTIQLHPQNKAYLVSECGGFTRLIKNHHYSQYATYGYGGCESEEELTKRILDMYHKMILPSISQGVCGCIYTQVSDVEDEINGLYTYDRKVLKVNKDKMQQLANEIKNIMNQI